MCYDKYIFEKLFIIKHIEMICARCKRRYPSCVTTHSELGEMCPICYCMIKSVYSELSFEK